LLEERVTQQQWTTYCVDGVAALPFTFFLFFSKALLHQGDIAVFSSCNYYYPLFFGVFKVLLLLSFFIIAAILLLLLVGDTRNQSRQDELSIPDKDIKNKYPSFRLIQLPLFSNNK